MTDQEKAKLDAEVVIYRVLDGKKTLVQTSVLPWGEAQDDAAAQANKVGHPVKMIARAWDEDATLDATFTVVPSDWMTTQTKGKS